MSPSDAFEIADQFPVCDVAVIFGLLPRPGMDVVIDHRVAKRRMTGVDWAAWAATRALIEAVARTKSTDFAAVSAYLKSPDLSLDGYKGTPMSFRPWDGQLRQPILLAGHDAVVDRAPLEGFLHPTSYLDTLGADEPESGCKNR